jgi:hypothetical protein
MRKILMPVVAVALGFVATPVAHADVMGTTGYIGLPLQNAQCVVAPQRVLCMAPFKNAPPSGPAVQGEPTISADTNGAVTWGWGSAINDDRAVGDGSSDYQMPPVTRYHISGWTVERGNGAVVTFTNDGTGHGLRVEGADSLPPIEASGF